MSNKKSIIELLKGITVITMLFIAWEIVKFVIVNVA